MLCERNGKIAASHTRARSHVHTSYRENVLSKLFAVSPGDRKEVFALRTEEKRIKN